jgi:hypothetical protein
VTNPFAPILRIAASLDAVRAQAASRRAHRRMQACEGYAARRAPAADDYLSLTLFRCRGAR